MSSNRSRRISPISTTPKLLPAALPSTGETWGSRAAAAPQRCASALGRVVCGGAHWRRAARAAPFPRAETPPARRALPARGDPPAAEFDSDPARLADDGVTGSDTERRGDVACALSLDGEFFLVLGDLRGS